MTCGWSTIYRIPYGAPNALPQSNKLSDSRNIKFVDMLAELSAFFDSAGDVSFKYQLPDEDLEALISVTDEEDLDNMMALDLAHHVRGPHGGVALPLLPL